jgi:hypothetical protein
MKRLLATLAVLLAGVCSQAYADEPDLREQILEMDRLLFDAFNARDIETSKRIFDPDLEFYHDTGGVSDFEQTIANSQRLFEADNGLTRELIVDSVSVHPIAGYGAIQIGKHRFCHPEKGVMDCGVFDFVHVWKRHEDSWTLTRVISYGH